LDVTVLVGGEGRAVEAGTEWEGTAGVISREPVDQGVGHGIVGGIDDLGLSGPHTEGDARRADGGPLEQRYAVHAATERRISHQTNDHIIGLAEETGGEGVPNEGMFDTRGRPYRSPGRLAATDTTPKMACRGIGNRVCRHYPTPVV
jgi:hypothetical protein